MNGTVSTAFCQNSQRQLRCSLYQPSSVADRFSDISRFIAYAAMPNAMSRGGSVRTTKPTVSGTNTPDASPAIAWNTTNAPNCVQSGSAVSAPRNTTAPATSTRRVPNMNAAAIASGPTNICDAVNAVLIHAPSSKPMPSAPRTSASPSDVMREVSVAMIAPSSTAAIAAIDRNVGMSEAAAGAARPVANVVFIVKRLPAVKLAQA